MYQAQETDVISPMAGTTNTVQESTSVGMQDLLKVLNGKHIPSGGTEWTHFVKLWLQSQILPPQFSSLQQQKSITAWCPVSHQTAAGSADWCPTDHVQFFMAFLFQED